MKALSYFFILTVIPLLAAHAESFFKYAEIKESTSLTIPVDSEKENSYGGSAGLKFAFGKKAWNLDTRAYITLSKTKGSVFGEVSSPADFFALMDDLRYGAGIRTETWIPVTVKTGMLSFSKSLSRLENPAPASTANPLAKSFGFSTGIGANLPTLASAVKPLALSVSVTTPQEVPLSVQAQCAVTKEKNAYASIACALPLGKALSLQSVFTAGRMLIENKSACLTDTNADFSSQWLYGLLWESAFRSPWLKVNIFTGAQEMPFRDDFSHWAVWIKTAARTSYRNMLIDIFYFFIPTLSLSPRAIPLVGGSSTVCRTVRQFGLNPQMQFELHNAYAATFRLGLHALFEKKILNTVQAEQYSTLRLALGFAYESKPFTTKITAGVSNVVLDGRFLTDATTPDSCYSADISSSFSLQAVRSSISLGYDRYPKSRKTGNTKDVFSLNISASPGKKRMLTLTGGANISYKNGEKAGSSTDAGVTVTLKSTFLRAILKCTLSLPL